MFVGLNVCRGQATRTDSSQKDGSTSCIDFFRGRAITKNNGVEAMVSAGLQTHPRTDHSVTNVCMNELMLCLSARKKKKAKFLVEA